MLKRCEKLLPFNDRVKTVITTKYEGRLGNNLFQFAFSAVLSKLSGVPFAANEITGFPGTIERSGKALLGGQNTVIRGQARDIDLENLAAIAQTKDISIGGHPQSAHYYEPHREWLRRLLAPEAGDYTKSHEKDVVLHLRIGDFFYNRKVRNAKYPIIGIHRLLRSIDFDKCLIVTDSPDAPMVKALREEFRAVIVHSSVMHDYRTLYHAQRLVISPSTFSWWAAWSGAHKQIFFPFNVGFWQVQKNSLLLKGENVRYWAESGLQSDLSF